MIPVFVTTWLPREPKFPALQRFGMALATIAWWLRQPVQLTILAVRHPEYDRDGWPRLLRALRESGGDFAVREIPLHDSQRRRHQVAAELAGDAPLYILTDDDIVPWGQIIPWAIPDTPETVWDHIRRVFAERPGLKMCSAYPLPSTLRDPMQAPGVEYDPDVWHVSSTGGVRVIRGGAVGDLPPHDHRKGPGYDTVMGDYLRGGLGVGKDGPAVGYFRRWCANHYGYRASVVWPGSHGLGEG